MTWTSDLETWVKVSVHPLPQGTFCVKFETE